MKIRLYTKNVLRALRDILYICLCYFIDAIRFLRFGGWKNTTSSNVRVFKNAKIYHAIEKSLSSRNFDKNRGRAPSILLRDFLTQSMSNRDFKETYTDLPAYKVLELFDNKVNRGLVTPSMRSFFSEQVQEEKVNVGANWVKGEKVPKNWSSNQKSQLFSRHSARDFSSREVSETSMDIVLRNAFSAPSACNRNPWYVYKTNQRNVIDRVLRYQNGNSGFGHLSQGLFIVTVDLFAYDSAAERRQAWVDGGIFLMNLVTAIHVEGMVSCCLNWCKYPWQEKPLKTDLKIPKNREIIAMLALGYPNKQYKVCASQRPPLNDVVESNQ